jgi:hypothetical protein
MLHKTRTWCISIVTDPEELALKLCEQIWTRCTGFEMEGYLFLNDSTWADSAQEYAVLKRPAQEGEPFFQVESITFEWCSKEKGLNYIRQVLAGEYDHADYRIEVSPRLETKEDHGTCYLCAKYRQKVLE